MVDPDRVDELAEELTSRLGIPFIPTRQGTIAFRDRLRVSDWAVPLIFDGHVRRDAAGLLPADFVAHALWPHLRSSRAGRQSREWWSCALPVAAAEAIIENLVAADPLAEIGDDHAWTVEMLVDAGPHPHRKAA